VLLALRRKLQAERGCKRTARLSVLENEIENARHQ
jgi:hypothetical protein